MYSIYYIYIIHNIDIDIYIYILCIVYYIYYV